MARLRLQLSPLLLPLLVMMTMVTRSTAMTTSAWRFGSSGSARWSLECQFAGHALSSAALPSSRCGDACVLNAECSHWSWSPDAAGDGTCWLKRGASNAVLPHGQSACGFLPARFSLDESDAFDLGVGTRTTDALDSKRLSDREAETLLRTLNFFRSAKSLERLQLDVRLALAAMELAATCPSRGVDSGRKVDATSNEINLRGFDRPVLALSAVTAPDAAVQKVMEAWMQPSEEAANATAVGFAKRADSYCRSGESAAGRDGTTAVWTLLLA